VRTGGERRRYHAPFWLYRCFWPSTQRHTDLVRRPLSHDFEPAREDETFRLLFFGDLMRMKNDAVPRVDSALRELLGSADLVIGNCEAPVMLASSRRRLVFQMPKSFVRAFLEELGVDPRRCVLSVANNHIGDQGEEGLSATLEHLRGIGVTPVGNYRAGEYPLERVICGRLTLGITAWTFGVRQDVFQASPGVWRVQHVTEQPWSGIKEAEGIDCLIGTPHWEYEFQHFPRPETQALAWRLVESGFDVLVGHHPHVIQPMEWVNGGLCLYSIGGLATPVSLLRMSWPVRLAAIFEVRLRASGPDRGRVVGYTLHPVVQDVVSEDEVSIVPLEKAKRRLSKRIERRLGILFQLP
jgi:poly-gamma-glutamate capsule biosynthesis protein CapA/YwtB (metallophosphatase superfamily)